MFNFKMAKRYEPKMIKLQTADGRIFEAEERVVRRSNTLKMMLDDIGVDNSDAIIPVPVVRGETLELVLKFANHYKYDPIGSRDKLKDMTAWDEHFVNGLTQGKLFFLIAAANYLDMEDLLQVGAQTVRKLMEGRSAEEIRQIFNIRNDFGDDKDRAANVHMDESKADSKDDIKIDSKNDSKANSKDEDMDDDEIYQPSHKRRMLSIMDRQQA